MATEIFDITVKEVSLVDKGANNKKFLLMKKAGDEKMQEEPVSFLVNWKQEKLSRDWWSLLEALRSTLNAILVVEDVATRLKLLDEALSSFKGLLVDNYDIAKRATEEDTQAQEARSKKYKIGAKEGKAITMPTEYADMEMKDDDFADPVNYAYPVTEDYVRAARAYSAKEGAQKKGGYTDDEWQIIAERITEAAKKFKIGEFAETKKADEVEKAGAVLSAKNKQLVQGAVDALQALLSTINSEDDAVAKAEVSQEELLTEVAKVINKRVSEHSQYLPTQADIDEIVDKCYQARR